VLEYSQNVKDLCKHALFYAYKMRFSVEFVLFAQAD